MSLKQNYTAESDGFSDLICSSLYIIFCTVMPTYVDICRHICGKNGSFFLKLKLLTVVIV